MRVFEAFESVAAPWLESHPRIPGKWEREKNWRFLEIPPYEPGGFRVRANCSEEFVYIMLDRTLVVEFNVQEYESVEETAGKAFALLRLCLSTSARLHQQLGGTNPFRWTLEVLKDGSWQAVRSHRSVFYNWFAPKSDRILQNNWVETNVAAQVRENGG